MEAGRELDALIADKVFAYQLDYELAEDWGAPMVPALRDQFDELGILPFYSADHNAVALVRDEIARRKLKHRFINELYAIVSGKEGIGLLIVPDYYLWTLVNASPAQQCLAALKAVGVEV